MGIPSYFSKIIKKYPMILRNLGYFQQYTIQHLYMDCNSIIYDAVHQIEWNESIPDIDYENAIIDMVIINIGNYIRKINPTTTVYIAFDGEAPLAKMEQQRSRRYKSGDPRLNPNINLKAWSTNMITPGTHFMDRLSSRIYIAFQNSEKTYNVKNVAVSCSDEKGEGEHKMFAHVRLHSNGEFLADTIAIYGLDADLIMLSIFHQEYCNKIFVFREAPEFIHVTDVNDKNKEPLFIDINELSDRVVREMNCKIYDKQRIYDYVVLCFFLGNDFLPHFPALNIRTTGLDTLLNAYNKIIGNTTGTFLITPNKNGLNMQNIHKLLEILAKEERRLLIKETESRDRYEKIVRAKIRSEDDEIENISILNRGKELYICPSEEGWERRYKASLMLEGEEVIRSYKNTLIWVYRYYMGLLGSEKEEVYKWHYGPILKELKEGWLKEEIEDVKEDIICISMSYAEKVLPKERGPECKSMYDWSYTKYNWESHPIEIK